MRRIKNSDNKIVLGENVLLDLLGLVFLVTLFALPYLVFLINGFPNVERKALFSTLWILFFALYEIFYIYGEAVNHEFDDFGKSVTIDESGITQRRYGIETVHINWSELDSFGASTIEIGVRRRRGGRIKVQREYIYFSVGGNLRIRFFSHTMKNSSKRELFAFAKRFSGDNEPYIPDIYK